MLLECNYVQTARYFFGTVHMQLENILRFEHNSINNATNRESNAKNIGYIVAMLLACDYVQTARYFLDSAHAARKYFTLWT